MRRRHSEPAHREQGQTLVVSILFLGVLLGFCALLIDGGSWMWMRRSLQGDADAAALAAAREMSTNPGNAQAVAEEYAEDRNSDDQGTLTSFVSDSSTGTVTVRVERSASASPFGKLLARDSTKIGATATARVAQISYVHGMLPFAALEGTLEFGNPPIPERITFSPGHGADQGLQTGHVGAVAPLLGPPSCTSGTGNSANELEQLIGGSFAGSPIEACGTPIGDTIDTSTGDRPMSIRDGFNDRFGSNDGTHSDLFADVVHWDPSLERYVIDEPSSPRIGFIPVISTGAGVDDWDQIAGVSRPVEVIDYVMVYIGYVGEPGEPAYVRGNRCTPVACNGQQIQVFLTPLEGAITPDFDYELSDTWNADSNAPIAVTLVE